VIYLECFRRLPGVEEADFRTKTLPNFEQWSQRYPQDELLGVLARTWRLGPDPYLLVWRFGSSHRWDEWNHLFTSTEVDDLESPILEVMETYSSGFYREVRRTEVLDPAGIYYLEDYVPNSGDLEDLDERSHRAGGSVEAAFERIGRLGRAPGGLALARVPSFASIIEIGADASSTAASAGVYTGFGREVL
jgi:hypothetical protein